MATTNGFSFSPLSAASIPTIDPRALQFVNGASLGVGPTQPWVVPSLADVSDIVLAGIKDRNAGILSGVESLAGGLEKGGSHLIERGEKLHDDEVARQQHLEDEQARFDQAIKLAGLKPHKSDVPSPLDNAREAYWRQKTLELANKGDLPDAPSPYISPSDSLPPTAAIDPAAVAADAPPEVVDDLLPTKDEVIPPVADLSKVPPLENVSPEVEDPFAVKPLSLANATDPTAVVEEPVAEEAVSTPAGKKPVPEGRFWAGHAAKYLSDAIPVAGLPDYYEVTLGDGKTRRVIHAPKTATPGSPTTASGDDIEGFVRIPVSTMADGKIKYKFVPSGVDGAAAVTGRPLLQGQMTVLSNLENAEFSLNEIEKKINGISERGPAIGQVRGRNPYDAAAQALENQVNSLVPGLARGVFGEVGVLTDEDVNRYKKMIPNIRTDPTVGQTILKDLRAKLASTKSNNLQVWQKAGYNVGAFAPQSPTQNAGRVAEIEKQLQGMSADDPAARPLIEEYKKIKAAGGQ